MGLHAGVRKRFKATVVKLRKQFPRIVVKYTATEGGGVHPLELPDPITACTKGGSILRTARPDHCVRPLSHAAMWCALLQISQ